MRLLVALLGGCLLLGACSGGDDESASTTTEVPSGDAGQVSTTVGQNPVVTGQYAFTGALELTGTYEARYPAADPLFSSCERIAGPEAGTYIIPVPTAIGEMRLSWLATLAQYDGPGHYELAQLGELTIGVQTSPATDPQPFQAGAATTVTVDVDEANRGSFEFSGLLSPAGDELAGSLTWSCQ